MKPKKEIKLLTIFLVCLVVALAICMAVILRWAYESSDVLEVKNNPVPVRTIRNHPKPGGVVILDVNYCKNVNAFGTVRTSFIGKDREIFLPTYTDKQDPVCQETEVPVLVPRDLLPGKYHVHFRIVYKVNPLKQNIVETLDSKPFEVVN